MTPVHRSTSFSQAGDLAPRVISILAKEWALIVSGIALVALLRFQIGVLNADAERDQTLAVGTVQVPVPLGVADTTTPTAQRGGLLLQSENNTSFWQTTRPNFPQRPPPPSPKIPPDPLLPDPSLPPSPCPIAPPPPPAQPPTLRVEELNARFRRSPFLASQWREDGSLPDSGLLVHIFDGWENHEVMHPA